MDPPHPTHNPFWPTTLTPLHFAGLFLYLRFLLGDLTVLPLDYVLKLTAPMLLIFFFHPFQTVLHPPLSWSQRKNKWGLVWVSVFYYDWSGSSGVVFPPSPLFRAVWLLLFGDELFEINLSILASQCFRIFSPLGEFWTPFPF